MRSRDRLCLGQRGATAVETALALPIFLLVILGGLDVGLWLLQQARLLDATDRALSVLAAAPPDAPLFPGEQRTCVLVPVPQCDGPSVGGLAVLPQAFAAARQQMPTLSATALIADYRAPPDGSAFARISLCVTLDGPAHRFFFLHWLPGIARDGRLPPVRLCDYTPLTGLARLSSR